MNELFNVCELFLRHVFIRVALQTVLDFQGEFEAQEGWQFGRIDLITKMRKTLQ